VTVKHSLYIKIRSTERMRCERKCHISTAWQRQSYQEWTGSSDFPYVAQDSYSTTVRIMRLQEEDAVFGCLRVHYTVKFIDFKR